MNVLFALHPLAPASQVWQRMAPAAMLHIGRGRRSFARVFDGTTLAATASYLHALWSADIDRQMDRPVGRYVGIY